MKKYILHLSLFGISKSAVLLTPLLAATVLSPSNYGLLEWSLSFAMMLGILLSLGSGGLISFEVIKYEKSTLIDTALSHSVIISLLLGILAGISIFFGDYATLSYILAFTGIFVGQFTLSAYIKAQGKGAYASVVESLIYILILFLLIYAVFQKNESLEILYIFPLITIVLSISLLSLTSKKNKFQKEDFLIFIKRGLPIMLSGFLAVGFVNLPRVLLGNVTSFEDVATFSLYFRWAAIALVAYQFALVMNFRKIYTYSYDKLERYILLIAFMVLLIGVCIIIGLVIIEKYDIPFPLTLPLQDITIQILMASTIAFWAIGTSLEGLFYREDLSRFQIYASLFGIGIFLLNVILFKFFTEDIILLFTFSWFVAYTSIIFVQIYFLNKYLHANLKNIFYTILVLSCIMFILFGIFIYTK